MYVYNVGRGFVVGKGFLNIMFGDKPAYPVDDILARGVIKNDTLYVEEYTRKLSFKPFVDFVDKRLIKSTLSEKQYLFAKSITTGVRVVDFKTKSMFYDTGVGHILAISGLHVGIIFVALNGILKFLRFGRLSYFLSLIFVWVYAFFVGLIPSVVRAAIMLSMYSFSKLVSRPVKPVNVYMCAFALCLFWEPLWIFSPSFWLSFSAILGFILFPRNLFTSIFGASVFSWVFSLYYFGKFALLTLPINLLVIPLTTLYMYSQILAMFINYPFSESSYVFFLLIYKITEATYNLGVPLITFKPPLWFVALYVSALLTLVALWRLRYAHKTG